MRLSRFRRNPKAFETQRRRDAETQRRRDRKGQKALVANFSNVEDFAPLAAQKSTQYASRQGHRQKSSRNAKDHEHCEGARRRAIAKTTPAIRSPVQIPSDSFSFLSGQGRQRVPRRPRSLSHGARHFHAISHPANPRRMHPKKFTHFRALFFVAPAGREARQLFCGFVAVGLFMGPTGNFRRKTAEEID